MHVPEHFLIVLLFYIQTPINSTFFSVKESDDTELSLYSENSQDDDFFYLERKSTKKRDKKLKWKIASLSPFQRKQLWANPTISKNKRIPYHKKRKEESQGNSLDILRSLEKDESIALCPYGKKQSSFEEKVLNLLSKCRDFCPKIYRKLDRLAKKSKESCSRTNFGRSDQQTDLGEYSY